MKKENLAILLGFFNNQIDIIKTIIAEIETTSPTTRESLSHLGYLLHNLYCALEDCFQEVCTTFENRIEDPSRYHRELLKRVHIEIPGIRPRLLSQKSYALLDDLRGFRHVFRHSYTYELSLKKLKELKEEVLNNWDIINQDLNNFIEFLSKAIKNSN